MYISIPSYTRKGIISNGKIAKRAPTSMNEKGSSYYLHIVINDKPVTMKIDSGCHDSIINMRIWEELGQPQLEPVLYKRYSATRAEVVLKGLFIAHVQYEGRIFELPVTVSNQTDTRNLMGRRWFPIFNLDWNGVFQCTSIVHPSKIRNERQRLQELKMTCRTNPICIKVKVAGFDLLMMFDTGATQSKISSADWEKIGKPELEPTQIVIRDTTNTIVPLAGQCTISFEYNGQKANLPVLVSSGKHAYSVIGTDWFKHIKFDFNNIFENLTFKQTTRSNKTRKKTIVNQISSASASTFASETMPFNANAKPSKFSNEN